VLGFELLDQPQLPVLRPNRYNCFVFLHRDSLRPHIQRTPWSSRPDTVFLLESWRLLNDLPRSKVHTVLGCEQVDHRRCCFQRICYYDVRPNYTSRIERPRLLQKSDLRLYKFSTVDLHVDTGSCYRCRLRYEMVLLYNLQTIRIIENTALAYLASFSFVLLAFNVPFGCKSIYIYEKVSIYM